MFQTDKSVNMMIETLQRFDLIPNLENTSLLGALSPFGNLGKQHNGRRAEPWMKKITMFCVVVGMQKGFAREHQNGFDET